jgi:hypothetical protein
MKAKWKMPRDGAILAWSFIACSFVWLAMNPGIGID